MSRLVLMRMLKFVEGRKYGVFVIGNLVSRSAKIEASVKMKMSPIMLKMTIIVKNRIIFNL